jgi:hypothetical protein
VPAQRENTEPLLARSLKTQQQTSSHVEVDVDLGEPDHGRITKSIDEPGSHQW